MSQSLMTQTTGYRTNTVDAMNGIVVSGWAGLPDSPSRHYANTIGAMGVSTPFRTAVGQLVDGCSVQATAGNIEIYSFQARAEFARIAALDDSPGADRCFVIEVWSRTANDGQGAWHPQRPTPPALLRDVLAHGMWQLYNCLIALRPALRSDVRQGIYPRL